MPPIVGQYYRVTPKQDHPYYDFVQSNYFVKVIKLDGYGVTGLDVDDHNETVRFHRDWYNWTYVTMEEMVAYKLEN